MWGSSLWAEAEIFRAMVTCSPLSGVEKDEYFNVLPWAKAAGEYLMGFIRAEKMPRKLKVAFSSSPSNLSHATYRDLGFAARPDGCFDVYSAGGLGSNPRFGVLIAEAVKTGGYLLLYQGYVADLPCVWKL